MVACTSPSLFAACRVLHRLHAPRHPPCALSSLTIKFAQNKTILRLASKQILQLTCANFRILISRKSFSKICITYSVVKELLGLYHCRNFNPLHIKSYRENSSSSRSHRVHFKNRQKSSKIANRFSRRRTFYYTRPIRSGQYPRATIAR